MDSSGASRDDGFSPADPDSFLSDSAAGSFQNDGYLDGGAGLTDADFGFYRPDFGREPLAGTVQLYERHVFLCYKSPQVWPAHVEAGEFDRLPRLLSAAVMARKGSMKKITRLTICEGHDGIETSNGDVLIFPDMVRYRSLTHFDVDPFVDEVLVKEKEWLPEMRKVLKGWHIFVCCHGSRDRRCGVCGPALVTKFKEDIDAQNLNGRVSVSPCSHIGGDKYAGNVIIFGGRDGKITGHWYGYVAPEDVPVLLERHICKGEIFELLWRGMMGLSEDEQRNAQEQRLRLNGELVWPKDSNQSGNAINTMDKSQLDSSTYCCQENGASCCQNTVPVTESSPREPVKFDETHLGKEIKGNSNSKTGLLYKPYSRPTWYEFWEREDTYAAIAVVGAVVSIAFAYCRFRHLD